jgi:hypothetical protein
MSFRLGLASVVAAVLLVVVSTGVGAMEFFAVSDVYPGLKGYGKTVIRGTKIEKFDVEVIDVLPNQGFDGGPMILVRCSGPAVDESNGIAAGYSGSPVYIGGKLLGAISSAIPWTDTHVGGVTPVSSMLASLDVGKQIDVSKNTVIPPSHTTFMTKEQMKKEEKGETKDHAPSEPPKKDGGQAEPKPTSILPGTVRSLVYTKDLAEARAFNLRSCDGRFAAVPLSSPIEISGVSPKYFEKAKALLDKYGVFMPVMGGSTKGMLLPHGDENQLEAGDAIGVSLVTGDVDMTAIGTLTYVDGEGRVLAFGHPFFLTGESNMPLAKAYIFHTYTSPQRAFKDGMRIKTVGTITRDKGAAVGGLIGQTPDMVPLTLTVSDIDTGKTYTYNCQVIRNKDLFSLLVMMATGSKFEQAMNRKPGGTSHVWFELNGVGLKEPIKRENYFYDSDNALGFISYEALPAMSLLIYNNYRDVKLTEVKIGIEVTSNRVNASIDKAEIVDASGKSAEEGQPVAPAPSSGAQPAPGTDSGDGKSVQTPPQAMGAGEEGPAMMGPGGMPPEMKKFKPGDTIHVKVRVQPYRKEPLFKDVLITIPKDFPPGVTAVMVSGGGGLMSPFNDFGPKGEMLMPGMLAPSQLTGDDMFDLDKIITDFLKGDKNNELVVEIKAPLQVQPPGKPGAPKSDPDKDKKKEVKIVLPTDWVLYNGAALPILIEGPQQGPPQSPQAKPGQNPSENPQPPAGDGGDGGGGD